MRMIAKATLIAFCFLMAHSASGGDVVRVLVPLSFDEPIAGALGSLWKSELWVVNTGADRVFILGAGMPCNGLPECPPLSAPPGVAIRLDFLAGAAFPGGEGRYFSVPANAAPNLAFNLRIQDISRQAETWGTSIPIIPEQEFHDDRIDLLDVPITSEFRRTLRVYGSGSGTLAVRVEVRAIHPSSTPSSAPDEILGSQVFELQQPDAASASYYPAYLQIGNLEEIIPAGTPGPVRVSVFPASSSTRIWAFMSVTNNETQHVTTILPRSMP